MENNSELEKLKARLYKKGETFRERERQQPSFPEYEKPKTYWEEENISSSPKEPSLLFQETKKTFPMMKIILIAFAFLILVGGGAIVYFLLGGVNIVSSDNIDIEIDGPVTLKGGEEGNWRVSITNKNKTGIELSDLIIEYPDGSKPITSSVLASKNLYERKSIGAINPSQTVEQSFGAVFFGEKDSEKIVKLTLEYRTKDSNAILAKSEEISVKLLQSPIEIFTTIPKEANSGDTITIEVDVNSNAEAAISDIFLKTEYPAGFRYANSDLKTASGNNIWRLGDVEPGKSRKLKIAGIIEGEDMMEMVFRFSAGPLDEKGEISAYGFSVQTITLKKSFLNLSALVNGKEEAVASAGDLLNIEVHWKNTLPVKVNNAIIQAKITSAVVNKQSINVNSGFYRTFDDTLVWNSSSLPDLEEIKPGVESQAQFRFSILNPLPGGAVKEGNLKISLEIEMTAQRILEGQGNVEIKNSLTKEIKIATRFQLARRGLYHSGPFSNSGPLPPEVGKETTYNIVWSLTNSSNEVSDATASAFLPAYVRWLGNIEPKDANISCDQATGEIVWRIGSVSAGTGVSQPAKEVAFQISFMPSVSQIGTTPTLVSEAVLGGKDIFTGVFLRDVKSALTTYLDTDPEFNYNEARVVP